MGRIQTGRLENFLRRWASIKGGGSVLSETLGEVFPVLDLENLTPENQVPAGWTPFFSFVNVIGVAAQLTGASIINLAGSDIIVVVDKIVINRETSGTVTIGTQSALFASVVNTRARDTRLATSVSQARIGANANVPAAELGMLLQVTAGADREFEHPSGVAILGPGTQFAVVNSTVNDNLSVSFFGRARVAEPSELSF